MKLKILQILFIAAALTSCSTAYKTGQTPDDVYFSPVTPHDDYVRKNTDVDKNIYTSNEDMEIRRRIYNRRYRRYDDRYNYPNAYNNYPVYTDPKYGSNQNSSQPRRYNLDVYKDKPATNTTVLYDPKLGSNQNTGTTTSPVTTFDKSSNKGSGVGNFIRKIFSGIGSNQDSYNNSSNNSGNYNNNYNNKSNNNNNNNSNSNSSNNKSTNSSSVPVRKFDN